MVEDWIGKILIDKRFERSTEIILTPQVEELEDLTNVTIFLPSAEAFAQLPEPFTEMLAAFRVGINVVVGRVRRVVVFQTIFN